MWFQTTRMQCQLFTWIHHHSETLLGLILGLSCSIPIGFYLSLYSGLIVARSARFEELRYELIRILQSLEWPPGSHTFILTGSHRPYDIVLVSSDLIPMGHTDAGNVVMKIGSEVYHELGRQQDFLSSDQKQRQFTAWMRAARTMKPNKRPIFDPRLRLYKKVEYDREDTAEPGIAKS